MRYLQSLLLNTIIVSALFSLVACEGPSRSTATAGQNEHLQIESKIFELPNSHWAQVGTPGNDEAHLRARINSTEISDEIVADGKVVVYFKSGGKWQPLPYTRHRGAYHFSMDFEYGNGYVDIMRFDSDQIPVSNSGNEGEYKVVVATADGLKNAELKSIDLKDYKAVASVLDLN